MDGADESALAGIFATALQLADDVAPASAPDIDGATAGAIGMSVSHRLRELHNRLDQVPLIDGIPPSVMEHLKALARIVRTARTECVAFGDMARHLARSNMRNIARDGWSALTQSRPKNQGLLDWADDGTSMPQTKAEGIAEFIGRLIAGPEDVELSVRELALLEAHLKQAVDYSAVQRERQAHPRQESATWNRHKKLKLIRDFNRNLRTAIPAPSESAAAELVAKPPDTRVAEPPSESSTLRKAKRSTERGEGRTKLIAALTAYHKYADGSCLNLEPIGNNELARAAAVSESTASEFFNKEFGGHVQYRRICADATRLVVALKLLNGEFSPHQLFGIKPPDEADRHDEK